MTEPASARESGGSEDSTDSPASANDGATDSSASATATVYERLRRLILDGVIPPATVISQSKLATELGVSRTPLREALRRLQQDGLVEAERHRRPRVPPYDFMELESVFSQRIVLESFAVGVTVARATADDLADLERLLAAVRATRRPTPEWEKVHREFHMRLVSNSGPYFVDAISRLWDRSYRYGRPGFDADESGSSKAADEDHVALVQAFFDRDPTRAAHVMARHAARVVLVAQATLAPERDPQLARSALAFALGAEAPFSVLTAAQ
ncbi:MAG: GntR family transcriptional regulator [Candidatus Limnocylindria bacterium]